MFIQARSREALCEKFDEHASSGRTGIHRLRGLFHRHHHRRDDAGPVVAPAFLGLVPVVLAISGDVQGAISWRSLQVPFALAVLGYWKWSSLPAWGCCFTTGGPRRLKRWVSH